jgi:hypothetical protein
MGMVKKLTVLDIGDRIALKDRDNDITHVGKILDILDYWDEEVYHVEYVDCNGTTQQTTVTKSDIDLVKQKELYFAP